MGKRKKVNGAEIGRIIDTLIDSRPDPINAASLARSYGIEEAEIVRVLKMKGRYHG